MIVANVKNIILIFLSENDDKVEKYIELKLIL